jgi:hypothetical protein
MGLKGDLMMLLGFLVGVATVLLVLMILKFTS